MHLRAQHILIRRAIMLLGVVFGCQVDNQGQAKAGGPTGAAVAQSSLPFSLPPSLPTTFLVDTTETMRAPAGEAQCALHLRDSTASVVLSLVQSSTISKQSQVGSAVVKASRAVGDYSVRPVGAFGVGNKQLVRVDCANYAAIAVIQRN